jgi:hypothetical protein
MANKSQSDKFDDLAFSIFFMLHLLDICAQIII